VRIGALGILAVAVASLPAGCGSGATTNAGPHQAHASTGTQRNVTLKPLGDCLSSIPHAHIVRFRSPGERLRAAVAGSGSIGVVLANQSENSVCAWLPFPSYLAAHGMRVLAFTYGNGDESAEVQAAARFLRVHGAHRLALVGASIGGAVVIDAAVHMHPAPAAVIGLSAVPDATPYRFPADARRLTSPNLQVSGTSDYYTQNSRVTRDLNRESPSPAKKLLVLPGSDHGTDFVGATGIKTVRRVVLAFILSHARG
jgi:pimeloyl-ACP methyl ester carboxylesterase